MKEEEILALLRLQKTPMIGDIVAKKLIAHVGYANDIFKEKKQILQKINGIGKLTVQNLFDSSNQRLAEQELQYIKQNNINYSYFLDKDYNQVVENFIDDSYYHIFQYRTCKEGNMKGSGRRLCRLGKAIKILIRCMDTEEKFNATREFIYLYNKEETLNQVA